MRVTVEGDPAAGPADPLRHPARPRGGAGRDRRPDVGSTRNRRRRRLSAHGVSTAGARTAAHANIPQAVAAEGSGRHRLPRSRGHVVLGAAPDHRGRDLLLPAGAHHGHRADPHLPAGVRRRDRHLQEPDHGPRRARPRRCGGLPRVHRPPHHPHRRRGLRPPPPARPVLGGHRALAARDGRVRAPSGDHDPPGVPALMTATVPPPRTRPTHPGRRFNVEQWGWIYMRVSGAVLVVLIFGHLFINLVTGDGVRQIDFAFVAGKYATPFWQIWDALMLWLALIHGANGMRTIVNDYVLGRTANRLTKYALVAATVLLLLLGTLVIFTF